MAKAKNVITMDAKLNLLPIIEQLDTLASVIMDMGELMSQLGGDMSDLLVELKLQEMNK